MHFRFITGLLIISTPLFGADGAQKDIIGDKKSDAVEKKVSWFIGKARELFCGGHYAIADSWYQIGLKDKTISAEEFHKAKTDHAEALLGLGRYKEGFQAFDTRLLIPDARDGGRTRGQLLKKPWNSDNPKGKFILVKTEFGLGDTFFFLRYVDVLKKLGAKTIVAARFPEIPLLQECCPYIDTVINTKDEVDPTFYDNDVFMMSLPRYLSGSGLTPTTLPQEVPYNRTSDGPYIHARPEDIKKWNSYVQDVEKVPNDALRVGICWRASKYPAGQTRQLRRDISLSSLAALSKIPNVHLFSLQGPGHFPLRAEDHKGVNKQLKNLEDIDDWDILPEDCQVTNPSLYDLATGKPLPTKGTNQIFDGNWPFLDTAGLAANMDLVVSVDTSIPNLAAAMHKQTFLLLPKESDWRWADETKKSAWHPTVRIFRQEKQDDWTPVMENVKQQIHAAVIQKKTAEKKKHN
jgi:hypothetical protein